MTDDALLDRAIKAYIRTRTPTKIGGLTLNEQPCRSRSGVMRDFAGTLVVLANVNGTLATYRYQDWTNRLRRAS